MRMQIHRCTRKQCTPGDREYVREVRFVPPGYVPYFTFSFLMRCTEPSCRPDKPGNENAYGLVHGRHAYFHV